MLINDDLSKRTIVHADRMDWVASPIKGVDRRMLFRIGGEKARATSIVRYAPASRFSHHQHIGGEEFLVLDGVFQDESGDFPAGSYVRNPPGSGHAPGSDQGCVIFVKLWQFRAQDQARIAHLPGEGKVLTPRPGATSCQLLFDGKNERVTLEDWQAGADIEITNPDGLEILVLSGTYFDGQDVCARWTWQRLPAGDALKARVGGDGTRVWMKAGALLHDDVCAFEDAGSEKEKRP